MSHVTTHVLDATTGRPGVGMAVALRGEAGAVIAAGLTDDDGRLALGPDVLPRGNYELRFDTGRWAARAGIEVFYPYVTIAFTVTDAAHYHVPLLLSPFAYSTYRGS